ncbi:PorV/PorQ family protein [candidate division KSB1 bacterium]|nr:PorV/PorQ family protein [candidate division KSB1 bacterium]
MKRALILVSLMACMIGFLTDLHAQGNSDKSGTTAAQFLKIGVGARAMGLGGAFVAHADDIFSLYWNPAGINKVKSLTLGGSYTQWFADIHHQFFGLVLPVNSSSCVGFQAAALTMDPVEITTIDSPHGTDEFYDAGDLSIGVSYATSVTNFFALGITAKYIQQQIYNESASTFAFDIGSVLDIPFYGLKMGMAFSNFGGKLKLDGRDLTKEYDLNPNNTLNDGVETRLKTEPWDLPVNFSVGLAIDIFGMNGKSVSPSHIHRLTLDITGNHPADASEYVNVGLEYTFNRLLILRGGYKSSRDVEKMFYGAGLFIPLGRTDFTFDYALASFEELDYIHIFSASISF